MLTLSTQALLVAAASRYGIPVALLLKVAEIESNYSQAARSSAGAIGVMQLMPATAAELGVDPYNETQNIDGGARYLKQQFTRFGSWELALAAYNAGPGRVARGEPWPAETRAYVAKILPSAPEVQTSALGPDLASGVPSWVTDAFFEPDGSPKIMPIAVGALLGVVFLASVLGGGD